MDPEIMPTLFVGHGSPENALEKNEFTEGWKKIAGKIKKPKAILCISAHWLSRHTEVNNDPHPKIIYDFYGFPQELYKVEYPCNGSAETASLIKEKLKDFDIRLTSSWGIDHGTWVVLKNMYPLADIPVLQLSLDYYSDIKKHFKLGQKLKELRKEGVLIIGSGNLVHNLQQVDWSASAKPYSWAVDFDKFIKARIEAKDYASLINYRSHKSFRMAHPTNEHYLPLLYVLGASEGENPYFFNDKIIMGSLSMRCVAFGLNQ